jgi:hypothetical protein
MKNKKNASICFFLICLSYTYAQNNTSSPYSTRGFGEIEQFSNAYSRALGGVSNGIRTSRTISLSNPASVGAMKQVSLDFGFRVQYSKVYTDSSARTNYNGNFNYFGLAFPVYKKQILKDSSRIKNQNKLYKEYRTLWAVAFGIAPYSNINVSYFKIQDTTYGQLGNYYSKRGGLSNLYFINAVNLTPSLSLGLNSSFLFGQNRSTQTYYLFDTGKARSTFYDKNTQLNGFKFDLGLQGERNRDTIVRHDSILEGGKMIYKTFRYPVRFVYGATISNQAGIRYNEYRQVLNISNYYTSAKKDTVLNENNLKGTTHLPMSISAGFSATFNKLWMVAADYRTDMWSKIDKNLFNDSFGNSSQISLGFAYRPDPDVDFSESVKAKGKRKARIEYRFGLRMLNTGYLFKDNKNQITALKEYGISFGFGVPKTRTDVDGRNKILLKSLFNFTAEYIHRGNTLNGMLAENVFRLTIGFTLADNWFKQRKFY